jgi:HEPN domain-containing protein
MATARDLANQLLRRAADDLAAVEAMVPLEPVADAIVGFHAQQAVEKSLKAALAVRGVEFPFIHDIDGLTSLCEEMGASLPEELDGADRLTPYAAGLRYDDSTVGGVDRETARRWATAAVRWAGEMVQQDERSDDQISDAGPSSPPASADPPLQ